MQEPFDLIIKTLCTKFNVILQLITTRRVLLKSKIEVQVFLMLSSDVSSQ
jgi:hypothetical protein